jgi:hypothetical protein
MPSGFRSVRDLLTFLLGAAGIAYEVLGNGPERPTLLIVFAGLLGLPLVFREQDKAHDIQEQQDKSDKAGGDSERDGTG